VPGDGRGRPERRPLTDADQRRTTLARERIRRIEQHRRVCVELEQLASLVVYYGPRTPRPIPLGQFLAEQWWWAA
jgi:hypothetical protein